MTGLHPRAGAPIAGALLAALSGCATPPSMQQPAATGAPRAGLEVVGPGGALTPAEAQRALGRAVGSVASQPAARALLEREQAVTGVDLLSGNSVKLLVDGPAAYASMFEAIDGAREHIHLETYILSGDEIGEKLARKLLARRRQGVEVRIVYDAVGSLATPGEFFTRLREGGLLVKAFDVDPATGSINVRNHRKLLVVDGRVAFTGGINVSDVYSGSSFSGSGSAGRSGTDEQKNWRDTHLRIEGPSVAIFQEMFLGTWRALPGNEPSPGEPYLPGRLDGPALVRPVASTGGDPEHRIYSAYVSAIDNAARRVWLTQAYFAPNPRFLEALKRAARRGVDVRIMLPYVSDSSIVLYASQSRYAELLAAGVKLYRRTGAVLHAKTVLVDEYWSAIGSANLDYRSFLHNHEAVALVVSRDLAAEMEELFQRDLAHAERVDPQDWSKRGLVQRVMELVASRFEYWL